MKGNKKIYWFNNNNLAKFVKISKQHTLVSMMKVFSKALLVAAMTASLTQAKKGKMFEANAYLTPKREVPNQADPYLKKNLLNLA